jgi:hypothetical protein
VTCWTWVHNAWMGNWREESGKKPSKHIQTYVCLHVSIRALSHLSNHRKQLAVGPAAHIRKQGSGPFGSMVCLPSRRLLRVKSCRVVSWPLPEYPSTQASRIYRRIYRLIYRLAWPGLVYVCMCMCVCCWTAGSLASGLEERERERGWERKLAAWFGWQCGEEEEEKDRTRVLVIGWEGWDGVV